MKIIFLRRKESASVKVNEKKKRKKYQIKGEVRRGDGGRKKYIKRKGMPHSSKEVGRKRSREKKTFSF